MIFDKSWPRFAMESAIEHSIQESGLSGGRCTNIGCGPSGRYKELLSIFDVDGVDIVGPCSAQKAWRYHQVDAAKLPFPDEMFDFVIAIESFEYIEANKEAMSECARVLKPGGVAVITVPTHWTWLFEFGRHGPHYYSHHTLSKLVVSSGLKIDMVSGCGGVVLYIANLVKSWWSPIGIRIFRQHWWALMDGILKPIYMLGTGVDALLRFPPSSWVVMARKSE
jgi:SAM-dependent methyltransferase